MPLCKFPPSRGVAVQRLAENRRSSGQDSDGCLKLKHSGRELHGDLWTRAAMRNSACSYLTLGASTREIAPYAVLAIHSPKVVLRFSGGAPTPQARAAATERSLARIDRWRACSQPVRREKTAAPCQRTCRRTARRNSPSCAAGAGPGLDKPRRYRHKRAVPKRNPSASLVSCAWSAAGIFDSIEPPGSIQDCIDRQNRR
jgi:hypothetical protein